MRTSRVIRTLLLLFALAALPAFGQNKFNILDQASGGGGGFVYTGVLAGIPATCTVGQLSFITDATSGQNIYECTATNTWTQSAGGGVTSVTCSAPFACSPSTGAAVFSWTGATLTGTPANGDMSCWTGANTEALITNASGASGNVLTWANGVCPTWTAPAGGSALSSLTAATVAHTIANGDFLQTWQWAKTTDSSGGIVFNESAASTGGTSTSGVPNQFIVKHDTAAASTASPLTVYERGNHVFSVSPSTQQMLLTNGTQAAPALAMASDLGTGLFGGVGFFKFSANGIVALYGTSSQTLVRTGSGNTAGLSEVGNSDTGFSWLAANTMSVVNQTDGEWVRWSSQKQQNIRGSADATGYAFDCTKSRGTNNTPTVITTGDDLCIFGASGYVGATNTRLKAADIEFASTGTIADTTSGIGGTIKVRTAKAGTDTSPQTNLTITGGSTGSVTVAVGTTLNPATVAGIVGTAAADNAQAGSVGEVQTCTVATGSSVSLTTNTTANICTINTLPAGDWDCTGVVDFTFGATTSYTNLEGGVTTTSATLGARDTFFDYETAANVPTAGADAAWVIPTVRQNVGSATQIWLVAQATFTVSTMKAYGTLRCRRMR